MYLHTDKAKEQVKAVMIIKGHTPVWYISSYATYYCSVCHLRAGMRRKKREMYGAAINYNCGETSQEQWIPGSYWANP